MTEPTADRSIQLNNPTAVQAYVYTHPSTVHTYACSRMSVFLPVPSIDQAMAMAMAMAILIPQHASHATPAIQSSNWYSHKCYVFQSMYTYMIHVRTRGTCIYMYIRIRIHIYNTTVAYKYMYVSMQQGKELIMIVVEMDRGAR